MWTYFSLKIVCKCTKCDFFFGSRRLAKRQHRFLCTSSSSSKKGVAYHGAALQQALGKGRRAWSLETKSDLCAICIQEIKARAAESVRSARYAPLKLYECSVQAMWWCGPQARSAFLCIKWCHLLTKRPNFSWARAEPALACQDYLGGGRAEKSKENGRIFVLSALFRPSAVNQL